MPTISSDTSDINIEYHNSEKNKNPTIDNKNPTTDTDFYFGLIANPNKLIQNKQKSESSEIVAEIESSSNNSNNSNNSKNSKNSSKSSNFSIKSSPKYEKINISNHIPYQATQNNIPHQQTMPNNIPHQQTMPNNIPHQQTMPNNIPHQKTMPNNIPHQKTTPNNIPHQQAPTNHTLISNNCQIQQTQLTPQEIKMKRIELLRKLSEIKTKGFQLSKEYDYNSSIEEMEYEYELLKSFVDKRNGVKIFKNSLLQAVSVVEFLNDKYDPFDFHLSGWGEHMSVEVDSWEDVLEELYEKYKGSGRKMAPEIKLLYLIIASASAFHFTKTYASKLPGLDKLLASNPSLLSNIINSKKEKSQFMSQQEINIEKQKDLLKNKDIEKDKYIDQLKQKIDEQQDIINKQPTWVSAASSKPPPNNTIRVPNQVKDILNRLHNIKPTNTDTQDDISSNNDRIISDTTLSDGKKKVGRKPKKSSISVL